MTGESRTGPAFEIVVLDSRGGPLETDCAGYLVESVQDKWEVMKIWSWITGFAVGLQAIFDVSQCRTSARLQHASPQSISSYLSWGTIFDFTIYHLISLLLFQSDFVPYRPIKDGAVKRSSLSSVVLGLGLGVLGTCGLCRSIYLK
nr:hypothetical protein L203_04704 [Cryptococcus depauperatus CBS 7841]